MVEIMTDKQFDKIIEMISMILDGCKDLEEAKKKVNELSDTPRSEEEFSYAVRQEEIFRMDERIQTFRDRVMSGEREALEQIKDVMNG